MNITSLETILTDLDEARRQRNASNRRIEELIDALETQQRVIKQAHEDIAKLTAERDEWKKECDIQRNLRVGVEAVFDTLNEDIGRLKAEVNYWKTIRQENAEYFEKREAELIKERAAAMAENAAYYQLAKKEVWAVAESALREAKEALVMNIVGTGGRTPATHNAITTINKVLGEE